MESFSGKNMFSDYFFMDGKRFWFIVKMDRIVIKEHEEGDDILMEIHYDEMKEKEYDEKGLVFKMTLTDEDSTVIEMTATKRQTFTSFLRVLSKLGEAPLSYIQDQKLNELNRKVESYESEIKILKKTVLDQKHLITVMKNVIIDKLGQKVLDDIAEDSEHRSFLKDLKESQHLTVEEIKQLVDEEYEKSGILGQVTRDSLLWKATMDNCNQKIKGVLRRVCVTLRYGGLLFRKRGDTEWRWWWEENWPIVTALSHGGRLIIQLPPTSTKSMYGRHGFWKWLISGRPDCQLSDYLSLKTTGSEAKKEGLIIFRRLGASHSLQCFSEEENEIGKKIGILRKNGEFYDFVIKGGRQKIIYEKKTIEIPSVFSSGEKYKEKSYVSHRHWGLNVPMGGENQRSLDGRLISADGSNGHLYLYYLPPKTDKFGGIMIGLEGSEYGKKDSTGMKHSIRAKSNPYSPTYGYKFFSKVHKDLRPFGCPDKYNSMLIDFSITGWDFLVEKEKEWNDDMVFSSTQKVEDLKRNEEGIKEYVDQLRKKKYKKGLISSLSSRFSKRFSKGKSDSNNNYSKEDENEKKSGSV